MSNRGYSPDLSCRPPRHLNIAGCLLEKRFTCGGGGVTGTPGPPSYTLGIPLTENTELQVLLHQSNLSNQRNEWSA